jgi:hypothetical protein
MEGLASLYPFVCRILQDFCGEFSMDDFSGEELAGQDMTTGRT